ncbi:MAG: hypothetical protein ACPGFA_13500 [Pikeienuella sp.]
MTIFDILIYVGVAIAVLGLLGLVWCINLARRVKNGQVPEDQLQAALIKISAVNMASMGGAFIGLAILLVGLMMG